MVLLAVHAGQAVYHNNSGATAELCVENEWLVAVDAAAVLLLSSLRKIINCQVRDYIIYFF